MLACAIAILLFAGARNEQVDPGHWANQVFEAAPKGWAAYDMRARHIQGSWSTICRSPTTKEVISEGQNQLKQGDECALWMIQGRDPNYPSLSEAQVVNPRYAFSVSRSTPDSGWAVLQVGNGLWEASSFSDPAFWIAHFRRLPYTFGTIHAALSAVGVFDAEFSRTAIEPVQEAEKTLCRIEFSSLKGRDESPKLQVLRGWILLDPDHYWVALKYEVTMDWRGADGTETASLEYDIAKDGFPILKRIVNRRSIPARQYDFEWIREYDLREQDIPESEFTLSAFGLPEPPGISPPPKPTRWYLWIALAGGVSLLVATFFSWRIRKARAAAGGAAKP